MINVLFVCLGNICRSPMAEAIFKDMITMRDLEGKVQCDSAGIEFYHIGKPPDTRTMVTLEAHGITGFKHLARKLTMKDMSEYNYVIVMEKTVYDEAGYLLNGAHHKGLHYMGEFDPQHKGNSIKDPYNGTIKDFEEVYETLTRCCQGLMMRIRNEIRAMK